MVEVEDMSAVLVPKFLAVIKQVLGVVCPRQKYDTLNDKSVLCFTEKTKKTKK
jgi:hypothetical protein